MPEKAPRFIKTAKEAIHALGGPVFVAELFGFKGPNAVRNWYKRGLPPESMDKLEPRLRAAGCDFDKEALFQQYPIAASQAWKEPPAKKPRKNGGRK